jgi:NTP pyrophosphatase (non-canonical NTP hydrolase)
MELNEVLTAIETIDNWLDNNTSELYKNQPLAQDMARVAKAGEEAGEAFEAFLGATGQNPRKGFSKDIEDVFDELADVAMAGILGIQHFTKDADITKQILLERLAYRIRQIQESG